MAGVQLPVVFCKLHMYIETKSRHFVYKYWKLVDHLDYLLDRRGAVTNSVY